MPTMSIVGSTYSVSNTNYVTVTDASNMYNPTSHTSSYASLRGRAGRSSNSTYYAFISGFDFTSLPSEATVNSFRVLIRAYRNSYMASGNTNYRIRLASQPSSSYAIGNTTLSEDITTTSGGLVYEIPKGSLTWNTLTDYGTNFSIEIPLRNSSTSSSNYPYVYVYGAEVEVTYTLPVQYSVTVSNSTSATVTVSDNAPYEGDNVTVYASTTSGITIKDNGTDITNQFTQITGGTLSEVPGTHFTTGGSSSSAELYQNANTISTAWLEYAIGHSAESPYSTSDTNNTYAKPQGQTAWINYEFDFSSIPSSATITSVSVAVYGARENSTIDSTHVARFQCYSGSTAKGTLQNFTSTSNSKVTVTDVGTWTAEELHDAQLRFELGYYGGRMLGITWTVTYTASGYTYTITSVAADHTIVVTTSGGGGATDKVWIKLPGSGGGTDTLIGSVNVSDESNNATKSVDLSGFSVGDSCHVIGTLYIEKSGMPASETVTDIEHTFTWTGNSYSYTAGNFTLTITAASFKFSYDVSVWPSGASGIYAVGDVGAKYVYFYKSTGSGGGWTEAIKVYKKVNGSWVEQSDLTNVFVSGTNYLKG